MQLVLELVIFGGIFIKRNWSHYSSVTMNEPRDSGQRERERVRVWSWVTCIILAPHGTPSLRRCFLRAVYAYGEESREFPIVVSKNERHTRWAGWKSYLRQCIHKIYSQPNVALANYRQSALGKLYRNVIGSDAKLSQTQMQHVQ